MSITLNGDSGITAPTYGGTVPSEYQVPVTGFKNRLINGNGIINQRGGSSIATFTASPVSGTIFGVDRWRASASIPSGLSATVIFAGSNTTDTVNGTTASVISYSYNGSGVPRTITISNISQRIESKNCLDLVGQSVTLSFWVFQNTGVTISFNANLAYATAVDNFTATTSISNSATNSVPSGTWTYITNTFTSLPSGITNGLQVSIVNSNVLLTSVGQSIRISNAQLEKGSDATSFEYRPYGTELALCQRYYYAYPSYGFTAIGVPLAMQYNQSATTANGFIQLPVTMRIAPTALSTTGTATDYRIAYLATTVACSAVPAFAASSPQSLQFTSTVAAGLTAGQASILQSAGNASASPFLAVSAEL